jgi:hypothetical protein
VAEANAKATAAQSPPQFFLPALHSSWHSLVCVCAASLERSLAEAGAHNLISSGYLSDLGDQQE